MEHAMTLATSAFALPVGRPLVLDEGEYLIADGFTLHTPQIRVQPGRLHALVGPNGAGKTSLLRLLSGAQEAGRKSVYFGDGPPLLLSDVPQMHAVGVVSHAPGSWALGLYDRLCLDAALVGATPRAAMELAARWIEHLGLDDVASKPWSAMSAGFRMRAAIARQMVQGPPVLLLDEPLGPLDIATQRRVLDDLQTIARLPPSGVAVVLSSQHLAAVESVADDLIMVEAGHITYAGPRSQFGQRFGTTVFEVSAPGHTHALCECLQAAGGTIQRTDSGGVRAEFAAATTSLDVMTALVAARLPVQHLRELTNSAARLL
jgi:ABC-2 type transport system ATP-binding protein